MYKIKPIFKHVRPRHVGEHVSELSDMWRVTQRLAEEPEASVSAGPGARVEVNNCLDSGGEEDLVTCGHSDEK